MEAISALLPWVCVAVAVLVTALPGTAFAEAPDADAVTHVIFGSWFSGAAMLNALLFAWRLVRRSVAPSSVTETNRALLWWQGAVNVTLLCLTCLVQPAATMAVYGAVTFEDLLDVGMTALWLPWAAASFFEGQSRIRLGVHRGFAAMAMLVSSLISCWTARSPTSAGSPAEQECFWALATFSLGAGLAMAAAALRPHHVWFWPASQGFVLAYGLMYEYMGFIIYAARPAWVRSLAAGMVAGVARRIAMAVGGVFAASFLALRWLLSGRSAGHPRASPVSPSKATLGAQSDKFT